MTDRSDLLREQRRRGYVLMGGAAIVVIAAVLSVLFLQGSVAIVVAAAFPAAVLFYFGFRSYSGSKSDSLYPGEGRREAHLKAGQTAFWVLVGTIMVDEVFGVLPEEHLHVSLLYVGFFALAAVLGYEHLRSSDLENVTGEGH